MSNILFFISLSLIWVMLLYHMFLMQGGFRHYITFERNITEMARQRVGSSEGQRAHSRA